MRIITLIVFVFFSSWLLAQDQDTIPSNVVLKSSTQKIDSSHNSHSPKKASILSAILPGAGQVYNHQAWKLALIYGGMGTLGYFIYDNNKVYKDYLQQWKYMTDGDSMTNVRVELYNVSEDALHNAFSSYRKYRDQCIIGFVLLYAANIIDANVYAHLYSFNVDNLTINFKPDYNIYTQGFAPKISLKYKF